MERVVNQKQPFVTSFLILVVMLSLMPFITTFNDLLTRFVMGIDAYGVLQHFVVPFEVRLVGVLLFFLGFHPAVVGEYITITGSSGKFFIEVAWNCIGWQSLLFFALTVFVGLQGDAYTTWSKIKALVFGLIGTFLINIVRMSIVVLIAYYFGQQFAQIFHDYGSVVAFVAWLFFFWWFAYSFILETKQR